MLRHVIRKRIIECLNQPPLVIAEDFSIKQFGKERDLGGGEFQEFTELTIVHEPSDNVFFIARIDHEKTANAEGSADFEIGLTVSPGEIAGHEGRIAWGGESLVRAVRDWVSRIVEELQAEPLVRAQEELERRMQDVEDRIKDIPEGIVRPEQLEALRELLKALESRLAEKINELELSVEEKDAKIAELRQQFEILNASAQGSKVKTMLRKVFARMARFAAKDEFPKLVENGVKICGVLTSSDSTPK